MTRAAAAAYFFLGAVMGDNYRRTCVSLPERQFGMFEDAQKTTGLGMAELMRRMFDYCFQSQHMNNIVPSMSGTFSVGA